MQMRKFRSHNWILREPFFLRVVLLLPKIIICHANFTCREQAPLLSPRVTSAALTELSNNTLLIKIFQSDWLSACAVFTRVCFYQRMTDNERTSCFVRPLTRYLFSNRDEKNKEKQNMANVLFFLKQEICFHLVAKII